MGAHGAGGLGRWERVGRLGFDRATQERYAERGGESRGKPQDVVVATVVRSQDVVVWRFELTHARLPVVHAQQPVVHGPVGWYPPRRGGSSTGRPQGSVSRTPVRKCPAAGGSWPPRGVTVTGWLGVDDAAARSGHRIGQA